MIFGAATLHEVPWELIVKNFPTHLGDKAFNDLDGYAREQNLPRKSSFVVGGLDGAGGGS